LEDQPISREVDFIHRHIQWFVILDEAQRKRQREYIVCCLTEFGKVGLFAPRDGGNVVISHDRLLGSVAVRAGREGRSFRSARPCDYTFDVVLAITFLE
jgi:hypothetical protein